MIIKNETRVLRLVDYSEEDMERDRCSQRFKVKYNFLRVVVKGIISGKCGRPVQVES